MQHEFKPAMNSNADAVYGVNAVKEALGVRTIAGLARYATRHGLVA